MEFGLDLVLGGGFDAVDCVTLGGDGSYGDDFFGVGREVGVWGVLGLFGAIGGKLGFGFRGVFDEVEVVVLDGEGPFSVGGGVGATRGGRLPWPATASAAWLGFGFGGGIDGGKSVGLEV